MYEILEGWRNIYYFASPGYEKDAYRAVVGYPSGNIWTPGGKASYNYEARLTMNQKENNIKKLLNKEQ